MSLHRRRGRFLVALYAQHCRCFGHFERLPEGVLCQDQRFCIMLSRPPSHLPSAAIGDSGQIDCRSQAQTVRRMNGEPAGYFCGLQIVAMRPPSLSIRLTSGQPVPSLRRIQRSYIRRNKGCVRDCRYFWLRRALDCQSVQSTERCPSFGGFHLRCCLSQSGRVDNWHD